MVQKIACLNSAYILILHFSLHSRSTQIDEAHTYDIKHDIQPESRLIERKKYFKKKAA